MTGSRKRSAKQGNHRAMFACLVWTGLIAAAAVVVARRLSGQLNVPGTSWTAILTAVAAAVTALAACFLFSSSGKSRRMRLKGGLALGAATILPPVILGASLMPAASSFGVTALSVLFVIVSASTLVVADVGAALAEAAVKPRREPFVVLDARQHVLVDDVADAFAPTPAADAEPKSVILEPIEEPGRGPELAQTINRIRFPDRGETATGTVSVRLAANQRLATIHLPFVPAFPGTPEVVCRLSDGCDARLHVADVKPYGARVELKRPAGLQPEQVLELHFTAAMPSHRSDAA